MSVDTLAQRRQRTTSRICELKTSLEPTTETLSGKACVYLTGSFGRGEAGDNSDLDLFIVGRTQKEVRALTRLDEIVLKAQLIEATRDAGLPEFSGDGEYLVHYTVPDLREGLGTPHDDAKNTFTARLLLLLESRCLLGDDVYQEAITEMIAAYWRDYQNHSTDFLPAFLVNDIIRLWKTFCVNYEARTESEPEEKRARRKLHAYKLKHSRLLTCYSGILFLAAVFAEQGTVHPVDALRMTKLTPTERLEDLRQKRQGLAGQLEALVDRYQRFLENTNQSKAELVRSFKDKRFARQRMTEAKQFGDGVFDLLQTVASESSFYRFLVV